MSYNVQALTHRHISGLQPTLGSYQILITFGKHHTATENVRPFEKITQEQKMAELARRRWEDRQRQQEVVENYRRICMIVAPQLEEPLRTPTQAEFYSNIQIDDDSDDEQWSEDIHPREQITHLSYEGTLAVINVLVEARCPELRDRFRMLQELDQELFELVNVPLGDPHG